MDNMDNFIERAERNSFLPLTMETQAKLIAALKEYDEMLASIQELSMGSIEHDIKALRMKWNAEFKDD